MTVSAARQRDLSLVKRDGVNPCTPKALWLLAQGCRAAATLGIGATNGHNPDGVVALDAVDPG